MKWPWPAIRHALSAEQGQTPDHPISQLPDYSKVYDQLVQSYRAIDDFRMKLLGLLPLATSGIFLIADKNRTDAGYAWASPIGIFGFVTTIGLFAYELHGIKKCNRLIHIGQHIERDHLKVVGQFRSRPHAFDRIIDEPFAASIIYPASLAAWVFLAGYPFALNAALPMGTVVGVSVAVFLFALGWSQWRIRAMESYTKGQCGDSTDLDEHVE
jgi:hypothetical protein